MRERDKRETRESEERGRNGVGVADPWATIAGALSAADIANSLSTENGDKKNRDKERKSA
jgi:hypothetical protein